MHDVRAFLPEPFGQPGALLYVGYRLDACAWLEELRAAGNEVTALEIFPENVLASLRDPRVARFVVGDVRQAALVPGRWDYAWWWHGPEHVEKAEFPAVLETLCGKAGWVAVAAPWGRYAQGEAYGNPHERHLWSVYEEDLLSLGMEVETDGQMDEPGSEIVGVLR